MLCHRNPLFPPSFVLRLITERNRELFIKPPWFHLQLAQYGTFYAIFLRKEPSWFFMKPFWFFQNQLDFLVQYTALRNWVELCYSVIKVIIKCRFVKLYCTYRYSECLSVVHNFFSGVYCSLIIWHKVQDSYTFGGFFVSHRKEPSWEKPFSSFGQMRNSELTMCWPMMTPRTWTRWNKENVLKAIWKRKDSFWSQNRTR